MKQTENYTVYTIVLNSSSVELIQDIVVLRMIWLITILLPTSLDPCGTIKEMRFLENPKTLR